METTNKVKGLNLYQRMLLVSTEVMNVEKKMTVGAGTKAAYKAVADLDVILAVKKAEAQFGIISVPVEQELVDTQVMSYTDGYDNQKTQFVDIVKVTTEIYNADDPADRISVCAFGRGIDNGDKGFGKASTYARKYCLLNAYKIATGEDPDKDASPEGIHVAVNPSKPQVSAPAVEQPNTIAAVTVAEVVSMMSLEKNADEVKKLWAKYSKQFDESDRLALRDSMLALPVVKKAMKEGR